MLDDHGRHITPKLQAEVDSLSAIPMDDAVAEGPHTKAHRIMSHSRRSLWPWVAASMRLEQSLADIKSVIPALDKDLKSYWWLYTVVRVHDTPRIAANADFSEKASRLRLSHALQ